jgi:hypothetical protein
MTKRTQKPVFLESGDLYRDCYIEADYVEQTQTEGYILAGNVGTVETRYMACVDVRVFSLDGENITATLEPELLREAWLKGEDGASTWIGWEGK